MSIVGRLSIIGGSTQFCSFLYCSHKFVLYVVMILTLCSQCIGAGLHIGSGALRNNTAIYHSCRGCPLTLHCYSNSTSSVSSAVITTPNNGDQFSYSSYYSAIRIERVSPSGIRLRHLTNYRPATSGIYICKLRDSNGNQIQLSVGLYFSNPGMFELLYNMCPSVYYFYYFQADQLSTALAFSTPVALQTILCVLSAGRETPSPVMCGGSGTIQP